MLAACVCTGCTSPPTAPRLAAARIGTVISAPAPAPDGPHVETETARWQRLRDQSTRLPRVAGMAPIELPVDLACVLDAENQTDADRALKLEADGGSFAVVDALEHGRLWVPAGDSAAGAVLEVANRDFYLRGIVAADDTPLYPARQRTIAGVLVPRPTMPLQWHDGTPGSLRMSFELDSRIRLLQGGAQMDWSCADLSVVAGAFSLDASLGDESEGTAGALRTGVDIPVSATPDGAAAAMVRLEEDDYAVVRVVESGPSAACIHWWLEDLVVVGWVPKGMVSPEAYGQLAGGGLGGLGLMGAVSPRVLYCSKDVPIVAQVGERRAVVGLVHPDTPITVWQRDDNLSHVTVNGLRPGKEGRLLVLNSDLDRCK